MTEREHKLSLLLELGALLAQEVDLDALLGDIGQRVARAMQAERATVFVVDAATGDLRARIAEHPDLPEVHLARGIGVAGWVAESGEVVNLADATRDPRHFAGVDRATGFTTRTLLSVPVRDAGRAIRGVLQVLNRRDGPFTAEDETFLQALGNQVALALGRTTLRAAEGSARGVQVRGVFNHIVGSSPAVRAVYEQITRAAAVDATVLLRGETGAGKGLFARAIHANSRRRAGPFVTVDCTTLPEALVESELFGHEKGSFTGADRKVTGKVDAADGGTLFLDEVGELAPTVQARLLRFLQEHAFERVGGRATVRVDVRVLTATHRDLAALVADGRFRQDLFYRLRVVEITVPPLRARGGDEVVALAEHFLEVFTRRYGRPGLRLSPDAVAALRGHDWPGNVRELEHTVERAVVLSPDELIAAEHLGLPVRRGPAPLVAPAAPDEGVLLPLGLTLAEVEARYVEATLRACGNNRSQAARALGVGRNTLRRKAPKA
ncbi:MAG: sigma-54-dependent Fis family transcriptional regulator [Deltaproteobacteria bacterium]|nr:sigma-54-dependent Fis family transcriptional regulator [Myxococcales bacterium]MDP3217157.1 sigma-54-dependent Fis family transcriptional regulator [Deltaproteobacteria bacterium]